METGKLKLHDATGGCQRRNPTHGKHRELDVGRADVGAIQACDKLLEPRHMDGRVPLSGSERASWTLCLAMTGPRISKFRRWRCDALLLLAAHSWHSLKERQVTTPSRQAPGSHSKGLRNATAPVRLRRPIMNFPARFPIQV